MDDVAIDPSVSGQPGNTDAPETEEQEPLQMGGPRIVINPNVLKQTDRRDALAVAFNEGIRVFMEANGYEPHAEPTDEERDFFKNMAYADDEVQLRRTIIARIATFDTSVKHPTDEQLQETEDVLNSMLKSGFTKNDFETNAITKLVTAVHEVLKTTAANQQEPLQPQPRPQPNEQGTEEPAQEPLQPVSQEAQSDMGGGLTKQPEDGLVEAPTVKDLNNRPLVFTPGKKPGEEDGYATVYTMGVDEGDVTGKDPTRPHLWVNLPTVIDGRAVSAKEAIDHYKKTKEHLGKYNSLEASDRAAIKLHEDQAKLYEPEYHAIMDDLPTLKQFEGDPKNKDFYTIVHRPGDRSNVFTYGYGTTSSYDQNTGAFIPFTKLDSGKIMTERDADQSLQRNALYRYSTLRIATPWMNKLSPSEKIAMYDVAFNAGPQVFDKEHSPRLNRNIALIDSYEKLKQLNRGSTEYTEAAKNFRDSYWKEINRKDSTYFPGMTHSQALQRELLSYISADGKVEAGLKTRRAIRYLQAFEPEVYKDLSSEGKIINTEEQAPYLQKLAAFSLSRLKKEARTKRANFKLP